VSKQPASGEVANGEMISSRVFSLFKTVQVDVYNDFKEHPVYLGNFMWTPTATGDVGVYAFSDIFALYLASLPAAMVSKLANISYIKAHLRITAVIEGCPYAGGWLRVCFDPIPQRDYVPNNPGWFSFPPGPARSLLLPGIDVVPGASQSYQIDLPPPTTSGFYNKLPANNLNTSGMGSYGFSRIIISKLVSGTAVSPSCTVSFFGTLIDPEFVGLTLTMNEERRPSGVYSEPLAQISSVASAVSVIPELGPYATAVSIVSGAASKVLAIFGFSKPQTATQYTRISQCVDNMCHVEGAVDTYVLGTTQNNSLSISDEMCPMLRKKDMVISDLVARPTLINTFSVPTTTAGSAYIGNIPINPSYISKNMLYGGGLELTPMAWLAYTATQWCGTIDIDLHFVASVFHRGTFCIFYDAGHTLVTPTLIQCYATLPYVTVNVVGDTKYRYSVPWNSPNVLLPTLPTIVNETWTPGTSYAVNGFLHIFLLNPISTNGSTDPINIQVLASSPDMQFLGLTQSNFSTCSVVLTSNDPSPTFQVAASTRDKNLALATYGEYPHVTTKQIASRLSTRMGYDLTVSANFAVRAVVNDSVIMKKTGNLATTDDISLLAWMAIGYMGIRGSVEYAFDPSQDATQYMRGSMQVFRETVYIAGSGNSMSAVLPSRFPYDQFMSYAIANGSINPIFHVSCPQYANGYFRPVYPLSSTTTVTPLSPGTSTSIAFNGVLTGVPFTPNSARVFDALGDDGQFVFFRGIPPVVETGMPPI
jgi:hypothetical protein